MDSEQYWLFVVAVLMTNVSIFLLSRRMSIFSDVMFRMSATITEVRFLVQAMAAGAPPDVIFKAKKNVETLISDMAVVEEMARKNRKWWQRRKTKPAKLPPLVVDEHGDVTERRDPAGE